MQNLTYKCVDVMKKTKDTVNSQLVTAEKQNLVACLATIGINTVPISVPMDDNSVFLANGNTPGPRTVEAETQDWCDVIHAQTSIYGTPLNVKHRGSFCGIENIYNVPFDKNTPTGTAAGTFSFTDNFARSSVGSNYTTAADGGSGSGNVWTISVGELVGPAADGWKRSCLTTTTYYDFVAQAKIKKVGHQQLLVRASTDSNNFPGYGFQLRDNEFRLEDSGRSQLATASVTLVEGSYYQVKAECLGSTIRGKVWLDGTAEPGSWNISITNTLYSSGLVGFSGETSNGIFDDLVITPTITTGRTWCDRYANYCYNHVGSHVINGDIFAPIPEGTTHAFDGNFFTNQSGYMALFPELHSITNTYASSKGVSLVFMSDNNFSEAASGWLGSSLFSDQNMVSLDYYGQRQGSTKVQPSDYVFDWQQLYLGKDSNGGGNNNAGGIQQFWAEWGDLPSAVPNGAENNQASWTAFLNSFYSAIRDNLVSPNGHMVGFNYWGGWEGQNTSILNKTGSGASSQYSLNFRGVILQSYFTPVAPPPVTDNTFSHRDANRKPMVLATLNSDGLTPTPLAVNPSTHHLQGSDGTTGSNLPFVNAERDANRVPTIWATSSADGKTPIPIYCDSNGNLLIKST